MAATADQLLALAGDPYFRQRIRNIVLQQAAVVYAESGATTGHAARVAFALKVLGSPGLADQVADLIATRTNLVASAVTYDFSRRAVVTDATDAAILSQVASDWNMLAGV
jgi:hypothetical protein